MDRASLDACMKAYMLTRAVKEVRVVRIMAWARMYVCMFSRAVKEVRYMPTCRRACSQLKGTKERQAGRQAGRQPPPLLTFNGMQCFPLQCCPFIVMMHALGVYTAFCRRGPHHFIRLPVDRLPHSAVGAVSQLLDNFIPGKLPQGWTIHELYWHNVVPLLQQLDRLTQLGLTERKTGRL